MPKEIIVHRTGDTLPVDDEEWLDDVAVHVGWTNGNVQMATLTRATPPGGRPVEDNYGEGPWVDLSRGEVNRLISTLRKARDSAYGRDA